MEEEVERLPKLLDQAKQFQELGIDEKLRIIPKLEKEKQLNGRVNEELTRVKDAVDTLKDSLPDTVFLSDSSLDGLPHSDLLKQQRDVLDVLKASLTQAAAQLEKQVSASEEKLLPVQQKLAEKLHLKRYRPARVKPDGRLALNTRPYSNKLHRFDRNKPHCNTDTHRSMNSTSNEENYYWS